METDSNNTGVDGLNDTNIAEGSGNSWSEKAEKRRAENVKRIEGVMGLLTASPPTLPLRLAHTPVAQRAIIANQIAAVDRFQKDESDGELDSESNSDGDYSETDTLAVNEDILTQLSRIGSAATNALAENRISGDSTRTKNDNDEIWQEYRAKFMEKEKECVRLTVERSEARTELLETQDELRKMSIQLKEVTAELERYRGTSRKQSDRQDMHNSNDYNDEQRLNTSLKKPVERTRSTNESDFYAKINALTNTVQSSTNRAQNSLSDRNRDGEYQSRHSAY